MLRQAYIRRSGTLVPVKRLLIIGIGAGDPDHLTFQAAKAIAAADVFLIVDKGEAKHDLARLRHDLIEAHGRPPYRVVEVRDPERDRTAPAYTAAVEDWRSHRARIYESFITDELADGQTGALLVWGDPGVYDSTLAALEEVEAEFAHEVVPVSAASPRSPPATASPSPGWGVPSTSPRAAAWPPKAPPPTTSWSCWTRPARSPRPAPASTSTGAPTSAPPTRS